MAGDAPISGSFVGQSFQGKTILLDASEFRNCFFADCRLMYEGGALPVLSGCSFKDCRWTFGVAAGNTLAFLSALSKGGFRPLVEETLQALLSGSMLQQPNAEDEWTGDASRRPPLPPRIELGFGTFPVPRIVKMPKPRP